MKLLAVDPGKEKCGFALLSESGELLEHGIIATLNLEKAFDEKFASWSPEIVILGDGTHSKCVQQILSKKIGKAPMQIVNEHDSTYRARKLYYQNHPPKGIWRWIPLGLQVPPVPYDDYAAMLLGLRFLDKNP